LVLAVVYEAVANAGASGKGRKITRSHRVKKAVYPGVNLTFENVHKLFLFLFGMRPRTPLPWRQSHQVHADLKEPRGFANGPFIAGEFVAVRILVAHFGN
jgi:hypothetical protein